MRRRDRHKREGVDGDPIQGWSSTCFASAVALLLSDRSHLSEETVLIELLNARHEHLSRPKVVEPLIIDQRDIFAAVDSWPRSPWRGDTVARGRTQATRSHRDFPLSRPRIFYGPSRPSRSWQSMNWVIMFGRRDLGARAAEVHEWHGAGGATFVRGSPERPPVPNPLVTFTDEALLHDETFTVARAARSSQASS